MAYKKTINPDCVGFYKFIGDEIPAHKAYLTVETLAKNGIVLETEAKLGNLSFVCEDMDEVFCLYDIDEEADGIATVRSADSAASDAVFDLGGKRLDRSQLRKGMVYIIGGKKVLWNGANE